MSILTVPVPLSHMTWGITIGGFVLLLIMKEIAALSNHPTARRASNALNSSVVPVGIITAIVVIGALLRVMLP